MKLWNLYTKTIVFTVLVAILPLTIYLLSFQYAAETGKTLIEQDILSREAQQAANLWAYQGELVRRQVEDYAVWDDTYFKFIEKDDLWLEEIAGWISDTFGYDLLAAFLPGQELFFSTKAFSGKEMEEINRFFAGGLENTFHSGVINLGPQGLYIFAVSPVVMSDGSGEPQGLLLLGKQVDEEFLAGLEQFTGGKIIVLAGDDRYSSGDPSAAALVDRMKKRTAVGPVQALVENDFILGYQPLVDWQGQEIGLIWHIISRATVLSLLDYAQKVYFPVLIIVILSVLGATLWFVQSIVSPIRRLEKAFNRPFDQEVPVVPEFGPPEIRNLAKAYNDMACKLNQQTKKLLESSYLDELTGCYNRRYLVKRLPEELSRAKRQGGVLSIIFIDVNNMKEINDGFGHLAGDKVLVAVAATVKAAAREEDVLVRFGGDEFILIMPNTTKKEAMVVTNRLRKVLSEAEFVFEGIKLFLPQAATGIASYPDDGRTAEELLQIADSLMYGAKNSDKTAGDISLNQ